MGRRRRLLLLPLPLLKLLQRQAICLLLLLLLKLLLLKLLLLLLLNLQLSGGRTGYREGGNLRRGRELRGRHAQTRLDCRGCCGGGGRGRADRHGRPRHDDASQGRCRRRGEAGGEGPLVVGKELGGIHLLLGNLPVHVRGLPGR